MNKYHCRRPPGRLQDAVRSRGTTRGEQTEDPQRPPQHEHPSGRGVVFDLLEEKLFKIFVNMYLDSYLIVDLSQGSVVEMIVCVTGNPTPTVKWFKDGKVGYFDTG